MNNQEVHNIEKEYQDREIGEYDLEDGNGNKLKLEKSSGKYEAYKVVGDEKDRGYVVEKNSNNWADTVPPGSCISWYGQGERFYNAEEALEYLEELDEAMEKAGERVKLEAMKDVDRNAALASVGFENDLGQWRQKRNGMQT
jgi:hypothetical protein